MVVDESALKESFSRVKADMLALNEKITEKERKIKGLVEHSFEIIKKDIEGLREEARESSKGDAVGILKREIEYLEKLEKDLREEIDKRKEKGLITRKEFEEFKEKFWVLKEEPSLEKALPKKDVLVKEDVLEKEGEEEKEREKEEESLDASKEKEETGKKKGWFRDKFEKVVDFLAEEEG